MFRYINRSVVVSFVVFLAFALGTTTACEAKKQPENESSVDISRRDLHNLRQTATVAFGALLLVGGVVSHPLINHLNQNAQTVTQQEVDEFFKKGRAPSHYEIDERYLAFSKLGFAEYTLRLDIKNQDEERVGTLVAQGGWTRGLQIHDISGNLVSSSREQALSWGNQIQITDSFGAPIGAIEERVVGNRVKKLFTLGIQTKYQIVQNGVTVASSDALRYGVSKRIELRDPRTGQLLVAIQRDTDDGILAGVFDAWDVTITEAGSKVIDPRLIPHIAGMDTLFDETK